MEINPYQSPLSRDAAEQPRKVRQGWTVGSLWIASGMALLAVTISFTALLVIGEVLDGQAEPYRVGEVSRGLPTSYYVLRGLAMVHYLLLVFATGPFLAASGILAIRFGARAVHRLQR